jgi:hypothetical protein
MTKDARNAARSRSMNRAQKPIRVHDTRDPQRTGVLAEKGPEVSRVVFNDGKWEFINNDYLREEP